MFHQFPFPCRLVRSSARKTLSLTIEHGEVVVRAPSRASMRSIDQWVSSKSLWIEKHWCNQQRALSLYGIQVEQGAGFMLEGRRLQLHWHTATPAGVSVVGDQIEVNLSARGRRPEAERVRVQLQKWLRAQAECQLPEEVRSLGRSMNCNPARIEIKSYRRKWGQCSSTGVICLNWRVLQLPLALQRYVMIHELCHLAEMNHGSQFWALVERYCPEYRKLQRQMQQMGPLLIW